MTTLAIIGAGTMGSYSARALAPFADKVMLCDTNPIAADTHPGTTIASTYRDAVRDADFVLFCVPTEQVPSVMNDALQYCKPGAIIGGQTSRKEPEKTTFDEFARAHPDHNLHYLSIHTMCNPSIADPAGQILGIIQDSTCDEAYQKGRAFYGQMPGKVREFSTVAEHDLRTANTQINTSRTMLSIASSFQRAGCFPWLDGNYGSGLDAMKFSLAMRAESFEPHIYKGIQFGNPVGKAIVTQSMQTEQELFGLILGDRMHEYEFRVMAARQKIYGDVWNPMLQTETVDSFSAGIPLPNSHFSLVNYLVGEAEAGRDLFGDVKATTAMHTSLISMVDFLFGDPKRLMQTIRAPFQNPKLRMDDLVFHDEFQGWSTAIVFEAGELYDHKHAKMRAGLSAETVSEKVKDEVETSKRVVSVCTNALEARLSEN